MRRGKDESEPTHDIALALGVESALFACRRCAVVVWSGDEDSPKFCPRCKPELVPAKPVKS